MDAKWWFITWTTYGSWLPGDPRGFRTRDAKEYVPPPRRYAKPGEATYDSGEYADRHRRSLELSDSAVKFTDLQKKLVLDAIVEEIDSIPVKSAVVSVGATHIHWLALFDSRPIRTTVGRIKSVATRRLVEREFHGKRPWSKNCHMQSKSTEQEFRGAFRYIQRHVEDGCLIHTWSPYQADDLSSVS